MTDITYIRTWQGWLYLAVVMDLFSRMIVGWAARPTIAARAAGAAQIVDRLIDDVVEEVRRYTGGRGVAAVLIRSAP